MLCLPDRCVPPLLMDVSTSVGGCSLSSFSPAVTPLRMDAGVTRLAQGYEIVRIVCPTFCQRNDVVDFFYRNEHASLEALLAEGMLLCIPCTDTCPCSSIPTAYRSVASVLLVGPRFLLRVLRAEPFACFHKLWASWVSTRVLWFVRHRLPPFPDITKPRKGLVLRGRARPFLFFSHHTLYHRDHMHSSDRDCQLYKTWTFFRASPCNL